MISNSKDHPYRMIYFDCPEDVSQFSRELLRMLDNRLPIIPIQYLRWIGYQTYEKQLVEPFLTWTVLQQLLVEGANQSTIFPWFSSEQRLLFIGCTDRIAEQNPEFLQVLQVFAHNCGLRKSHSKWFSFLNTD
jgi:hypothetical protein